MAKATGKGKSDEKDIVERLRDAIRDAEKRGTTRYEIAKIAREAGGQLSEAQLSKLLRYQRSVRLDTADRILQAIGLRLEIRRKHP